MPVVNLVISELEDKAKELLYFKIVEHAYQHVMQQFAEGKTAKKDLLMKKKEVRNALCSFIIQQMHKAGSHWYMAIIGKDYGISLKYKKKTLLRFYLPWDYILMLYESPSISKSPSLSF